MNILQDETFYCYDTRVFFFLRDTVSILAMMQSRFTVLACGTRCFVNFTCDAVSIGPTSIEHSEQCSTHVYDSCFTRHKAVGNGFPQRLAQWNSASNKMGGNVGCVKMIVFDCYS